MPPGCPLLTATTIVAAPCCSASLPTSLPRRCVASAVRHASLITPVSSALDEARKSTLRRAVAPTFGVASGARAGMRGAARSPPVSRWSWCSKRTLSRRRSRISGESPDARTGLVGAQRLWSRGASRRARIAALRGFEPCHEQRRAVTSKNYVHIAAQPPSCACTRAPSWWCWRRAWPTRSTAAQALPVAPAPV